MLRFSVVVPVFGQPELLANCLRTIRSSSFAGYELLVSDDGSPEPDRIASIAREFDARLVTAPRRAGSAAARNRAARVATGDILVFFDSDVTVHPDTLTQLADEFDRDPSLDAVMGSYDAQPGVRTTVSQFRNLLHAYVHQHANSDARTFWTGCGAVRRERFFALGGLKESFDRPSIEDVEFGLRLHEAGGRIRLAPSIQVQHHKSWTMASMIRTDLVARALPWAELIHQHGLPRDLNFKMRDRWAVGLTALLIPMILIAAQHPKYWVLMAAALGGVAWLHAPMLQFFRSCRGLAFAAQCYALLLIYNLTCALGLVAGLSRAAIKRDRWLAASVLAGGATILAFQILGGAYRAEFDAEPDESGHVVSSLMVYDYLAALPRENPIQWAKRYYLHYPKVSIGHWPPGYYIVEALWWLMIPPSRVSAMLLNAIMMLLVAVVFYRLLRHIVPPWLSFGAMLLLIAAPSVQKAFGQNMADLPCLLCSTLLLDSFVWYLRRPTAGSLALMGVWLTCGMLTKGTALCLLPAPLVAVLTVGGWRFLKQPVVLASAAALVVFGAGWYVLQDVLFSESVQSLGAIGGHMPWYGRIFLPLLTGDGVTALAIGGILVAVLWRRPEAIAAATIFLSTAAVSYKVRAMAEERHFIIVVPAVLMLATEFLVWAGGRFRPALLAALPALALFPFAFYHQHPAGFDQLLAEIPRPSRMLVSSNGNGEGALIAETALSEKPFSSVVARASKILASEAWAGENYHLVTHTAGDIANLVDAVDVDLIVIHRKPAEKIPAHQILLQQMLQHSSSWKSCAAAGDDLVAYCRTTPPAVSRKPLRIDLTNKIGEYVEE